MKSRLLFVLLFGASTTLSPAQSRVSIAPTYWFLYNPYSYQMAMSYNGRQTQFQATGHNVVSSFGLTVRYHFRPQWNVSIGALYNRNTNYIRNPQSSYGKSAPFTTEGMRLPVFVSYRLTSHRLSFYFSGGPTFTNNRTFSKAPINVEGVVGIGLDYRFDSGLSLLVQPTASYSLTRPVNDAFYRTTDYTSYNLGIQTQVVWRF